MKSSETFEGFDEPGPGHYKSIPSTRVASASIGSSTFKSTTDRAFAS